MLTEEQLEYISNALVPLFQYLEHEVIVDIATRIQKALAISETAEIRARALYEMGYSPARIRREAMKIINADSEFKKMVAQNTLEYRKMIKQRLLEISQEAAKAGDKIFSQVGDLSYLDDLRTWEMDGKTLHDDSFLPRIVHAIEKQTAGEMKNLTRTTGFKNMYGYESIENAYKKELDKAMIKITSGAYSKDEVIRETIHNLADSGLKSIDYKKGKSKQLDSGVRLAVRTGAHQLAHKIKDNNFLQTGENLVYVSEHIGARNTGQGHANHEAWQGKVYYIKPGKNYSEEAKRIGQESIKDLWEATGYSIDDAHENDPLGFLGYNCRHTYYTWHEGISELNDFKKEEILAPVEINGKMYDYYALTQKQRSMERKIRSLKREKEALDRLQKNTARIRKDIGTRTREYQDFCKKYNLAPKYNNLRYEATSSDLQKTKAWKEYKNSITDNVKGDIIELRRDKLVSGKYKTSNEQIEDILRNELSGIKFTKKPEYNARIKSQGKTSAKVSPIGRITVEKIEIGRQVKETRECLIDSLIHEELEARIMERSYENDFYKKLSTVSEDERHKYINKVIKRFFEGKGIDYGLV